VEPPAAETAGRRRHIDVSSIVQIDAIGSEEMSRLSTMLMALTAGGPRDDGRLRIETIYDEERASMKIIVLGGLDSSVELLTIINKLAKDQP
jgi:hypothetical protein